MKAAEIPDNEQERLAFLRRLQVLDTVEELQYDDLTSIAAQICGTPISLVSLVDEKRQWFKSHTGLEARETPREHSFCAHCVHSKEALVVPDATKDERFCDNPLVTGEPRVLFYAGVPLQVEPGLCLGSLCVIGNEPRELEPDKLEALRALARQVESQLRLRLKILEMEELDLMKREFVSLVSHELRTPLTALMGGLLLVREKIKNVDLPTGSQRLLDAACRNGDRLRFIVEDIMTVTELEASSFAIELRRSCINKCIVQEIKTLDSFFRKKNVSCKVELDEKIEPFLFDSRRIEQVLVNLLSNAAKYSKPGGKIVVRSSLKGDVVHIEVEDWGAGIPASEQGKVFDKFAKIAHPGHEEVKGSGLGLYIVRKILQLCDGQAGFQSTENEGSKFFFTLPVH